MTGYYDLILGLIPAALLGITAVLTAAGLSLTTAVPLGASVSVGLIGHAMFVRGPDAATNSRSTADDSSAVQSNFGVNGD